jgi:hypothetical protein
VTGWERYADRLGPEAAAALAKADAAEAALAAARNDVAAACRAILVNGKAIPHRRYGRVKVIEVRTAAFGGCEVRFLYWTKAGAWSKAARWEHLGSFLVDTDPMLRTSRPIPPIAAEML